MKKNENEIRNLKVRISQLENKYSNGSYLNKEKIEKNIKNQKIYFKDYQTRLYIENLSELFNLLSKGMEIYYEYKKDVYTIHSKNYSSFKILNDKLITTEFYIDGSNAIFDNSDLPKNIIKDFEDFYIKEI